MIGILEYSRHFINKSDGIKCRFCFRCDDNIIKQYGKEHTFLVCQ